MTYTPAAMPELLVVGSVGSVVGLSPGRMPVMCYNVAQKRIEGHFFTMTSTSEYIYQLAQGNAFNVAPDTIATVYTNRGAPAPVQLKIYLYSVATALSEGAAYSAGATTVAGAISHTAYATTITLIDSNWGSDDANKWTQFFVLPYNNTHFLVVTPERIWRIRLSDGVVENTFAIDPANASYSRFLAINASASVVAAPVVLADGNVLAYFSKARNAANSADVNINALVKINPLTGATVATDYTTLTTGAGAVIPMPDGTAYVHRGSSIWRFNSDLSSHTTLTGSAGGVWQYGSFPDSQDNWWYYGSASGSPFWPTRLTASGGAFTVAVKNPTGGADLSTAVAGSWLYPTISVMDSNLLLVRNAVSGGVGASIGSYVGIYNKSDGSVATGYTKQQMLDYAGAMTITGSGFTDDTFARTPSGSWADPTLYTVREVLQLMGTTTTPGIVCRVWDGTTLTTAVPKVWDGTALTTVRPKLDTGSGVVG